MYTIKEVSEKMEVSEHTLRFWAKYGLFPFVKRDKNNNRIFEDSDLEWIKIVKCLRSVGLDNKSVKTYIELCIQGDSTIKERYNIIKNTRKKAQNHLFELKKQLELLKFKENYYNELIKSNKEDTWNPMNKRNKRSEK